MNATASTTLALALAALLGAGACGFKTAPRPPEHTAPVIPGALEAALTVDGVRLSWQRAENSADGQALYDLAAFRVERSSGNSAFETVATVEVTDAERVRQSSEFSFTDTEAGLGRKRYRVSAVSADGQQGPPIGPVAVTLGGPAAASD